MDQFFDIIIGIVILFLWVSSIVKKIGNSKEKSPNPNGLSKKSPPRDNAPVKNTYKEKIEKVSSPSVSLNVSKKTTPPPFIEKQPDLSPFEISSAYFQKDHSQEPENTYADFGFDLSGDELRKAIILSEILSPPRALKPVGRF